MATGVANALRQFRKLQIGKETTYGTEVAATRVLRIIDLNWADQGNLRTYTPDYSIGRLTRRTDVPTVTRTGLIGSSYSTDFSFEDILFPLLSGFKGGVTAGAELTASQGDRPWVFQLDPNTGDPTPDSYTMERRVSNGSTNWDRTALGVIVESFEISADQDGDVTKLTVNFWSRAPNSNAIATLSLQTPFTPLSSLGWKLYIDNSWAAMDIAGAAPSRGGGTIIATTMKNFTYRYFGGLVPALFIGDGRTDPSKHRFLPRGSEIEATFEYNAAVDAERVFAAAGTKRYVRLLGEDGQIGTGFNKTIKLQGAFVYPDGGFGSVGSSANGAETISIKMESLPDDDTESDEIEVINTLATFP